MNNFIAASFEIISLLEAANISEIFSPMNCAIVKFEIEKNIELVELKERSLNAKFLLSKISLKQTKIIPSLTANLDMRLTI